MRKLLNLFFLIQVLVGLQACVSIQSASVSDIASRKGRALTGQASEVGFLHLTAPNLYYAIAELTAKLQQSCDTLTLAGVQTILSVRDFLFVQDYEITMSCICVSN